MTNEDGPSLVEWLQDCSDNLARFATELEAYMAEKKNVGNVAHTGDRKRPLRMCVDEPLNLPPRTRH